MTPYPRIQTLDIDPARFSAMIEEMVNFQEIEEEDCDDHYFRHEGMWDMDDDGQPSEYDEWQDYMGGDDQDFGQYDHGEW